MNRSRRVEFPPTGLRNSPLPTGPGCAVAHGERTGATIETAFGPGVLAPTMSSWLPSATVYLLLVGFGGLLALFGYATGNPVALGLGLGVLGGGGLGYVFRRKGIIGP